MQKQRLGFIGLGVMGMPMARHLASAGYPLTVHDINGEALARLKGLYPGVKIATCASEVASASEIVITMLPSGREVRDAVLAGDGLLLGFQAGSLLLDTSSSEPWYTQEITAALRTVGVTMLDAPVSGAETGAVAAELVFMVGATRWKCNAYGRFSRSSEKRSSISARSALAM